MLRELTIEEIGFVAGGAEEGSGGGAGAALAGLLGDGAGPVGVNDIMAMTSKDFLNACSLATAGAKTATALAAAATALAGAVVACKAAYDAVMSTNMITADDATALAALADMTSGGDGGSSGGNGGAGEGVGGPG